MVHRRASKCQDIGGAIWSIDQLPRIVEAWRKRTPWCWNLPVTANVVQQGLLQPLEGNRRFGEWRAVPQGPRLAPKHHEIVIPSYTACPGWL